MQRAAYQEQAEVRGAATRDEGLATRARRLKKDRKFEESARIWRELVQSNPKDAQAMNELGSALACAGRFEEALQWSQRALGIWPDFTAAQINVGVALRSLGRSEEAISNLTRAIASCPDDAVACFNLGLAFKSLQRLDEALMWLRRASDLRPSNQDSTLELGRVLQALKRNDDAIQAYQLAHSLKPDCTETLLSLGTLLQQNRRFQEAAATFEKVVSLDPSHCDGWLGLGAALLGAKRQAESLAAFRRAIVLKPGSAVAYCNMSLALMDLGRIEEAIDACRKATFIESGSGVATFNLGCMLLALGNFREGWEAYDYRFVMGANKWLREDANAAPWTGEPLQNKTILIIGEQGNGDHIQFCRYVSKLSDLGATIFYLAPARLCRLLSTLPGSVKMLSEMPENNRFDFQCPLMHLPGLFNRLGYPMPTEAPYLAAEPERVARWKNYIGDAGFRIGIVWQSNNDYGNNLRSYRLDALRPLAKIPDVRLISLQINQGTEQLKSLPSDMRVETLPNFDVGEDGFLDAAAALKAVDLVVSCDTSIAHLAGALGRPVWIALNDAPEWRWQRQRRDSIWYPTARLFRQKTRGDWDKVFLDMAEALTRLLQKGTNGWPAEVKMPMVEVSWGELLDKISILEIKVQRMQHATSVANVRWELEHLRSVLEDFSPLPADVDRERAALRATNETLWDLEDAVRACEAERSFDASFVDRARKIYTLNDRRASIKKQINILMKSTLIEEKEHRSVEEIRNRN
jgi:tetratricopeptide (TPR) repeat protein